VPREAFPTKYVRGLPRYDLPLILLTRLAVDGRFAGRGIGHALISEAFRVALRVAHDMGSCLSRGRARTVRSGCSLISAPSAPPGSPNAMPPPRRNRRKSSAPVSAPPRRASLQNERRERPENSGESPLPCRQLSAQPRTSGEYAEYPVLVRSITTGYRFALISGLPS
jgi:hypothetical protein